MMMESYFGGVGRGSRGDPSSAEEGYYWIFSHNFGTAFYKSWYSWTGVWIFFFCFQCFLSFLDPLRIKTLKNVPLCRHLHFQNSVSVGLLMHEREKM